MIPSRTQLDELKYLSKRLFGAESRWQKMKERSPVFSHYEPFKPTSKEYKKAKAQFDREYHDEPGLDFVPPKRAVYRTATIEELLQSMRMMSNQMDYASPSKEAVIQRAAADFVARSLPVAVVLEVAEDKKQEFDNVRAQLPGDYHPWIDKMVNADLPPGAGVRLDGVAFARAVVEKTLEATPRSFSEILAEKTAAN